MAILVGLAGGWVTAVTGGIAAAFIGHAATRFAVFLSTGHAGQFLPARARGRGDRGEAAAAERLAGDRAAGVRPRAIDAADGAARAHERRLPRPPGRGSTSTSRSASRSVRTATSSWSPARPRADRRTGSRRSWPRWRRARAARRRTRRGVRPAGLDEPPALETSIRRRDPTLLPAETIAGSSRPSATGSGSRATPRSRSRPTPGPMSAAIRRPSPRPGSTGSRSAPRASIAPSSAGSAGGTGRRRRATRSRRPRGRHRLGQSRLLYDIPEGSLVDLDGDARAALELEPDHLSLYALTLDDPDAEGLTGPDGDHLPTTRGARRWRDGRSPPRTRTGRRPSTTTPSIASATAGAATRSATGPGRATRAVTTWPTGSASRTRRSGPGRAFDSATRRWNARKPRALPRRADARPRPPRRPPARRLRDARRRDRDGRGDRPGPPHRPRRAALGRRRTAACGRLRLGARGRAPHDRRGRPDRPHDPRPAPVERALRPPGP